jgi:hypothetical protein
MFELLIGQFRKVDGDQEIGGRQSRIIGKMPWERSEKLI